MNFQQSLSSVLTQSNPGGLQGLIKDILWAKHQEDKMNNIYFRKFNRLFEFDDQKLTIQKLNSKDFMLYHLPNEYLGKYWPMKDIMKEIQKVILTRVSQDKIAPRYVSYKYSRPVRNNRQFKNRVSRSHKPRVHTTGTQSTFKSNTNQITLIEDLSSCNNHGLSSSSSLLSRVNHDLSKMINDFYDLSKKQANQPLPLPKPKLTNFKQKEKPIKITAFQTKASEIRFNPQLTKMAEMGEIGTDQNYGLKVLRKKVQKKSEKKLGQKTMQEDNNLKKKSRVSFEKVEQKGVMSPMTPRPRFLNDFKEWFEPAYSTSRNSKSRLKSKSSKLKKSAKSIETAQKVKANFKGCRGALKNAGKGNKKEK